MDDRQSVNSQSQLSGWRRSLQKLTSVVAIVTWLLLLVSLRTGIFSFVDHTEVVTGISVFGSLCAMIAIALTVGSILRR